MTSAPATPKPKLRSPSSSLSRREIRWGQALLVTFLLLVSLPYLWCYWLTPPGMTWGGLLFSAEDQNAHLMWAKQAQEGAFFIRDLFTTEGLVSGDRPLFFNLFTFGLGWFARLTGLDVVTGYHIARVAFAGLFVHQLHLLLVAATEGEPEKENARLGALALAVLTTGGGFLLTAALWLSAHTVLPLLTGQTIFIDHPENPAFVNVPEAFALLSALIYPLNIASFALLCFLLRCLIDNRHAARAFVAALVLSNIHTYDALPLLFACLAGFGFSVARRENVKPMLAVWNAVVIGLIIPVVYQVVVFSGSEEFRLKALTPTLPPAIWHIAASFFPLLLLGAWGWKSHKNSGTLRWLLIYALSVLLLVYGPPKFLNFSRKMIEGFQIPLLVFAGAGLAALPRRKWTAPLVIGICAVSPLVFFAWTLENAAQNNSSRQQFLMPPYYFSNADAGALLALQKVPDKQTAVLCLPLLGSYLPRATGLFTYTGHWAETLHVKRKRGEEFRFYRGLMTPAQARAFLKDNRIGYVIESPFERLIAPDYSVARALGLKRFYSASSRDGETVVYQVN